MSNILQEIANFKKMGDLLIPYNYPLVDIEEELIITPLKSRVFIIDGYEAECIYNKSRYPTYILETIQITPFYSPFLPFNMVCKIALLFLGKKDLILKTFCKKEMRIYYWMSRKNYDGESIAWDENQINLNSYEGFTYGVLKKELVNFL